MTMTKAEALRRCVLDFVIDQDACTHARTRLEPARQGTVWIRCKACGSIIDERPRCLDLTKTGQRCLGYVADGLDACSIHAGIDLAL